MVVLRKKGFRFITYKGMRLKRPYNYVLFSRKTHKPLGYSMTLKKIRQRERQIQFFKGRHI